MALKLLFSFSSTYRTATNGKAQVFDVKHDDTPPYAVRVYKSGSSTAETTGGYESHPYIGQLFNSTRYDGTAIQYKGRGEFPYAEIYVSQPLALSATKTDVTTAGGSDGAVTLTASGGVSPYSYRKDGGAWQSSNVFSNLIAGLYKFEVKDVQGTVVALDVQVLQPDGVLLRVDCNSYNLQQVLSNGTGGEKWGTVVEYNATECGYTVVYGCTNPEASNYDPNATVDNGSCILPEKLTAILPDPLTVAGNPVTVKLQAGTTGQAAAKAFASIDVNGAAEGAQVTINGQLFKFAESPQAGEFVNGATLAIALLDNEVIASRYLVENPNPTQVTLTALLEGSAYTPEIEVAGNGITFTVTAGVDGLRSQARKAWGCYAEIWACAGSYGSAIDKNTGVMLDRFERLYAPGNEYRFDLASTLRLKLRHLLFSEEGRMVPYFVRYGEVYLAEGATQRQRFPVGESEVRWSLDGALPLHQLNQLTAPLLLSQAPSFEVPAGAGSYAESLYILHAPNTRLQVACRYVRFDGQETNETTIDSTPATGGVSKLALLPVLNRAAALDSIGVELTITATLGGASATLGVRRMSITQYAADRHKCVVFLTSLGAYESIWLSGYTEASPKRRPALYGQGISGAMTTSSRTTGTRQVELQRVEKLHSGILDKEVFDYLAAELAASPEVFLFSGGTYTSCTVQDMDLRADQVEAEYFISLTVEPGLPYNPIAN